jgi:hypothetical protein
MATQVEEILHNCLYPVLRCGAPIFQSASNKGIRRAPSFLHQIMHHLNSYQTLCYQFHAWLFFACIKGGGGTGAAKSADSLH